MSTLKLYHGTIYYFEKVDLEHCKERKDFGYGFYLTSDYNQARDWALYIKRENGYIDAFVNMYKIERTNIKKLNIHNFQAASLAWIKYIIKNRITNVKDDFDLVIGKVADAKANEVIQQYILKYGMNVCLNNIDIQKRLVRDLHPERLTDQYCFKTNNSIKLLNKKDEYGKYSVSIRRI